MKKLTIFFAFLLFVGFSAQAQMQITGTITGAEDGLSVPGVSVVVKDNTTIGTTTNVDGEYSLTVPSGTEALIFSFVGMKTQEVLINGRSVIDVQMEAEVLEMEEVVVTALGISREKKSLGYAVQEIGGEVLTKTIATNVINSLSGRISGVQMIGSPGAAVGGSAKVRIRGVSGLEGGDPLYVIDGTPLANDNFSGEDDGYDFGNLATDLNAEDIDNISVLKGPSATALYGERAQNGVILITTKRGQKREGVGIRFTSGVTFDKVYILPEYQNEYGGGYGQEYLQFVDPEDGVTYNVLDYSADESWGPIMDGTSYRPWWSWIEGDPEYGTQIPMESNPDNIRDFFETGITNSNSISFDGGGDIMTYRVGYTNLNQTGVIPNSKFNKNIISTNLLANLTDKFTVSSSINISVNSGHGRPAFGYSPNMGSVMQSFNQWFQRQLDMSKLEDYKNPDGTFRSWNIRSPDNPRPLYWDSPYFTVHENYETDSRSRYFGNIKLAYQFNDDLNVSGSINRDSYTQRIEERIATGGLEQDYYREFVATGREENYSLLATYKKQFGDLTFDANVGGNIRFNSYHKNDGSTNGGLNSENLFTLAASVDRPTMFSEIKEKSVRSIYGAFNFDFRRFVFFGFTLRDDWSSSLPEDNNSYLYPSANVSLIFTELMSSTDILSFGKFRFSVAQVGSDVEAYKTNFTFTRTTPYGSNSTFTVPELLANSDLVPAISTSWETGLDLSFLQNRLGVDFSYYDNVIKDEILEIQVSGAAGYRLALINAGEFETTGWELGLTGSPFKSEFNWDIRFNIAQNKTVINSLYEDLDNYKLADGIGAQRWGGFSLNAVVGEEWGMMRGNGFTYIDGEKVITEDGGYVTESNMDLGSILPDFTGGITNSFSFKNFNLTAHIDFQIGGQFYSVTKMFNNYSGLGIETVGNNDKGYPIRDAVEDGGGILVEGVLEDGTAHSVYVDAVTYYGGTFGLHEMFVYDASFVKLRDLSFGYSLPKSFVNKTQFSGITLSIVGRNLWLISSKVDGIDPSEILPGSNNLAFEERGQLPGTRSLGLKFSFDL